MTAAIITIKTWLSLTVSIYYYLFISLPLFKISRGRATPCISDYIHTKYFYTKLKRILHIQIHTHGGDTVAL